jgi:hypothetical protein
MAARLELSGELTAASHEVPLFTVPSPKFPQALADMTEAIGARLPEIYLTSPPTSSGPRQADYARGSAGLSHSLAPGMPLGILTLTVEARIPR